MSLLFSGGVVDAEEALASVCSIASLVRKHPRGVPHAPHLI